ncbi:MAG: serine acetyltransferase [Planctomycetia bacterium]|nr:serine acetyltransferase [Planctomycetia bacterium]
MTTGSLQTPTGSPGSLDWDVDRVVADLRALRDASLAARQRAAQPVKLPSRKALAGIVDGLSAALFPNRLGSRELSDSSVDFFVGRMLDIALRELVEQLRRELQLDPTRETESPDSRREEAVAIVRKFAGSLPGIRKLLETDIEAVFVGDPAARSVDEVLACYPGITAVTHHRIAHELFLLGAPLVARMISEIAHSLTGIDIHPGARIGESFFIDHGTGVVVGETTVIGRRVRIYHGVTLGAKSLRRGDDLPLSTEPRHPVVEDDVVIYAGATILGHVTIGSRSVIGGNLWLTASVPPDTTVAQAEARNSEFDGGSGI